MDIHTRCRLSTNLQRSKVTQRALSCPTDIGYYCIVMAYIVMAYLVMAL